MSEISYNVKGAVAIIRFERPDKLNAFTYLMLNDFRAAVKRAADDPDIFGIVITGAGRAFSAGLDTGALAATAAQGSSSGKNVMHETDELPARRRLRAGLDVRSALLRRRSKLHHCLFSSRPRR